MEEKLLEAIEKIKNNKDLPSYSEEATKTAVVLPILSILGWDVFNREEVFPEYGVENRKVDFSLRHNKENKVFIETKKPIENLENHQQQILDYSFREGVKIAILTNGITWWFYLPMLAVLWPERKFYTIEIIDQDSDEIKQRFIDFLLKENIISGEAVKKAEIIKKDTETLDKIRKTLPEAWNKLISEKDKNLIDLLKDETEKMCGLPTSIEPVEDFIKNNEERLKINLEKPFITTSPIKQSSYYNGQNRTKISITFPGDVTIQHNIVKNTFAEAIIKIGIDRVKPLNLVIGGDPLIYHEYIEAANPYEVSSTCYISTHSSTGDKIKILKEIKKRLGINFEIKKVN